MQKTIVRRGLIAALFAFVMVLCCMPQKASADSVDIYLDGAGTLSGYTYTVPTTFEGRWYVDENNNGEATFTKTGDIVISDGDDYETKVSGEVVDFEAVLKDYAEKYPDYEGNTVTFYVYVNVSDGAGHEGEGDFESIMFVTIDAQAVVQDKVTEDTTFEYEVDALVERDYYDDGEYNYDAYRADAKSAQLVDNTLTIKKGNSVSDALDCLILAIQEGLIDWEDENYCYSEEAYFITEKDNKYGYARSTNAYGVLGVGTFEETDLEDAFDRHDECAIVGFDNFENGVDGFVAAYNAAEAEYNKEHSYEAWVDAITPVLNKLVPLNGAEKTISATFNHGVNTADNSDLGLWIALLAIAMVCGGAVALKRN